MLPSAPMMLLVALLSAAHAQDEGSLELVSDADTASEEGAADRRIGNPMFLMAYVLLAGLGVLTTVRTGAGE